jgi:hypothetical protein
VIVQPKNGRAKNRWSSNPVLNIIANFLTWYISIQLFFL